MIDTHVHIVSADTERHPPHRFGHPGAEWVDQAPDAAAFAGSMRGAGVERAVLVQPHGAYRDDNSYVCDAAVDDARWAAVAIVDMESDAADDALQHWISRGIRGLRLFSIPTPDRCWLDDPRTEPIWHRAAAADLVMGVCVLPPELQALRRAATGHAAQSVVLDHCGFALLTQPEHRSTLDLLALADCPNVTLKVTTHVLDGWTAEGAPLDELLPYLVHHFGAERVVWGSDYAQTHDRSYAELADLGRAAMAGLSADDAERISHANAANLWFD